MELRNPLATPLAQRAAAVFRRRVRTFFRRRAGAQAAEPTVDTTGRGDLHSAY
jgi:hypothetical protein